MGKVNFWVKLPIQIFLRFQIPLIKILHAIYYSNTDSEYVGIFVLNNFRIKNNLAELKHLTLQIEFLENDGISSKFQTSHRDFFYFVTYLIYN